MIRVLVPVAALLLTAPAALAFEGPGPNLFSTSACPGSPVPSSSAGCPMVASSLDWPNRSPYTIFAQLTLPAGTYLVQGKLSYWTKTPVPLDTYGNNECFIGLADLSQADYSSAGVIGQEDVVGMALPLRITRTSTVQLGCKLYGGYWDTGAELWKPVEVNVWGVRLIATRQ